MLSRGSLFAGIFLAILLMMTELLLRVGLTIFGYPFLKPSEYLFSNVYTNMDHVRAAHTDKQIGVRYVLILGGSVISSPWSLMEDRLDAMLKKHYGSHVRFVFYNIAAAGHTSLDNAIKYSLLQDKHFDLIIYYEGINENRANNVPALDFRDDYSHMKWYHEINLLRKHSEMDITVVPYLVDKLATSIWDRLCGTIYIPMDRVADNYIAFGVDIKTKETYRKNVESIIKMAKERGENLLVISYATYFPTGVELTGEQKDMNHFAGCHFASPVLIWGKAENIRKGVSVHNQVLRELVKKYSLPFFDMENYLRKERTIFCDVCHLSESGAQDFATGLSGFIIRQNLLNI